MNSVCLYGGIFSEDLIATLRPADSSSFPSSSQSLKRLASHPHWTLIPLKDTHPSSHEECRETLIQDPKESRWLALHCDQRVIVLDRHRIWNPRCYAEIRLKQKGTEARAFLHWLCSKPKALARAALAGQNSASSKFEQGLKFEAELSKQDKKVKGSFYTPETLARRMVAELFSSLKHPSSAEILRLRVLDPAMGAGHFLLAALDALAWKLCCAWSREEGLISIDRDTWSRARREIARRCLFGVEIQRSAVDIARRLLGELVEDDLIVQQALEGHLQQGNALLSLPLKKESLSEYASRSLEFFHEKGQEAFAFPLCFPELFFDGEGQGLEDPGFDYVIGNPPYVSYGLRGVGRLDKEQRAVFIELYKHSAEYKISIYALFVELGLSLLRSSGQLYFVLPDSFLLGRYFSKLRRDLLERGRRLHSLTIFKDSFWPVNVGRPVLLRASKRPQKQMQWRYARSLGDYVEGKEQRGELIETEFFSTTPRHRFYLLTSLKEQQFLKNLMKVQGRLSDFLDLFSGLIARSGGKKTLIGKSSCRGWARALAQGSSLSPFSLALEDTWVRKKRELYRSGYRPEAYEKPKILLNQTGFRLKAALDTRGLYVFNNFHVGAPVKRAGVETLDLLHFVVGVLNSSVAAVIYELLVMENGRAMAQVDLDVLRDFPMPRKITPKLCSLSQSFHGKSPSKDSMLSLEEAVLEAYELERPLFEEIRERVFRT